MREQAANTDLITLIMDEQRQKIANRWLQSDIMQCLMAIRQIEKPIDYKRVEQNYTRAVLSACVNVRAYELQTVLTFLIENDDIELPTYSHIHDQFYSLNKASTFQKTVFIYFTIFVRSKLLPGYGCLKHSKTQKKF